MTRSIGVANRAGRPALITAGLLAIILIPKYIKIHRANRKNACTSDGARAKIRPPSCAGRSPGLEWDLVIKRLVVACAATAAATRWPLWFIIAAKAAGIIAAIVANFRHAAAATAAAAIEHGQRAAKALQNDLG